MTLSVTSFEDYRAFLKAHIEDKARRVPGFSLRTFARQSNLSPSHLSRTLSGQKKLSASSAQQISSALRHSPIEKAHFLALIELERAKDDQQRHQILKGLSRRGRDMPKLLSLETFRILSDWYHFAILALTNTRDFQADAGWIARRLRIKPLEARFALDRLLQLGLLRRTAKGSVETVDGTNVTTTDDTSAAAIKENHRQHLELAAEALKEIPLELREFNNITLSMNLRDMPEAKRRIREFVDQFNREMETKPAQEIFQLNLQFYLASHRDKGQA